jgi:hypothetical protein
MAGEKKEEDPFASFTDHSNDEADTDGNLIVNDDSPEGGNDTTVDLLDEKGDADDQDNSHDKEELEDADGQMDDDDGSDNADGDDDDPEEDGDDEDEAEGAGGDNDDEAEGDGEEDDPEPAPKKNRSVKSRIAEFRKRTGSAERRASTAELRADQAEARLAELEAGLTPGANDGNADADETYGLVKPDPKDYKYGELDAAYAEANTDYHVDLKLAKRDAKNATAQQEAAAQEAVEGLKKTYDTRVVDGITAYPDFEEVVVEAADNKEFPLGEDLGMLVLNSDVGHHVLYKIAGDLKLAKKLDAMSPAQVGREFGRLEAQFAKRTPPKKNKRPNATPPASRRRGNKSGTSRTPGNTSDFAAFEAQADADQRARDRK